MPDNNHTNGSIHRAWTLNFTAAVRTDAFNFGDYKIMKINCPAGLAGVTMTFETSEDGTEDGTYTALTDDAGNAISITVAASQSIVVTDAVKALAVAGCGWMKLVSPSSQTTTIVVEGTQ